MAYVNFHCPYASQCSKRDITSTQSRASSTRAAEVSKEITGEWDRSVKSIGWRTWSIVERRWLAINRPFPFPMLRRSRPYFMALCVYNRIRIFFQFARLMMRTTGGHKLRWLKTVSSAYIWMGRYNRSLSLDATIMVSKTVQSLVNTLSSFSWHNRLP